MLAWLAAATAAAALPERLTAGRAVLMLASARKRRDNGAQVTAATRCATEP
jgi:hypothetical protein